jgi:hypothetical protein
MEVETKKRKIINQCINNHMVEKIDYGKIHIGKDRQKRWKHNCIVGIWQSGLTLPLRGSCRRCQKLKNINL